MHGGHSLVKQVVTLSFNAKVDLVDFWVSQAFSENMCHTHGWPQQLAHFQCWSLRIWIQFYTLIGIGITVEVNTVKNKWLKHRLYFGKADVQGIAICICNKKLSYEVCIFVLLGDNDTLLLLFLFSILQMASLQDISVPMVTLKIECLQFCLIGNVLRWITWSGVI